MSKPEMKPVFEERMKNLLIDENDFSKYNEIVHKKPRNFIRCNTLKISTEELFNRLKKKWNVIQPYIEFPEIMLIDQELMPGELGNAIEHILGYYYIQEVCSMMSVLALDPKPGERVLDLCASPGSKTTQIASRMKNKGTLFANDVKLDRLRVLATNLERCGVTNCVITRNDGVGLCVRLRENNFKFDKILLDVLCSGEGTLRSSSRTFLMWNLKVVKKLSREQKKLLANALNCLRVGGSLVYSTCTHSPEENEEVVDFALKNFPVKIDKIHLPLKCREGITLWNGEKYNLEVSKSCRIYPHDNDSEGFFVCKMTLQEQVQ
jgi:NOL1/NOP2/sun family putative RNA methylase